MRREALHIGGLVLIARVLTLPRTPWDADELRFPFAAMVAVSVAASVVTAIALAMWGAGVGPDSGGRRGQGAGGRGISCAPRPAPCSLNLDARPERAGSPLPTFPIAALLFSFSAAVLVHAPAARPDSLAWMFFALALLCVNRPALFGVFTAAAIACQPQFVISGVTLLFAALILVIQDRRGRAIAGIAFVATILPFAFSYGAPENLPWALQEMNVVRFTLHPWGSKFIALPLLVCVAAGIRPLVRKWDARLEVLMWFAFVHTAIGIAVVDPADGVRWAVPAMMFTSVVAALGLKVLRVPWVGAAVLCALSVGYALPILRDRVTRPSPPVEAAHAIPKGAVVLFEREPWPGVAGLPLDAGLRRYVDDPGVPLLVFANGNSNAAGARVFSREDHDAYGKLTRNTYRHVSLIPLQHRFVPLRGVYGVERNEAGESWRWLEREAEIRLPRGSKSVQMEVRLPAEAPIATNEVRIGGMDIIVRRGASVIVDVPLSTPYLLLRASRSFELNARDTRRVAVQLVKVESR